MRVAIAALLFVAIAGTVLLIASDSNAVVALAGERVHAAEEHVDATSSDPLTLAPYPQPSLLTTPPTLASSIVVETEELEAQPEVLRVRGTVVALDGVVRHQGLDGWMNVDYLMASSKSLGGRRTASHLIKIRGGSYSFQLPKTQEAVATMVLLDGVPLDLSQHDPDILWIRHLETRPDIELPWVPRVQLTIHNGDGLPVRNVEVFQERDSSLVRGIRGRSASPCPHDGIGGAFWRLDSSPLMLPISWDGFSVMYWLRTKGKAWARFRASDPRHGQLDHFTLVLAAGADIELHVKGLPWEGAQLQVRPADASRYKALRFPLSGSVIPLAGLPEGPTVFTITMGRRVLTSARCELVAGQRQQLTLDLTDVELPRVVRSSGTFILSEYWQRRLDSFHERGRTSSSARLELVGGRWRHGNRPGCRIHRRLAREVFGGFAYTLEAEVYEGDYLLSISRLNIKVPVSIRRGASTWQVRLPQPVGWELRTIDSATGAAVEIALAVQPGSLCLGSSSLHSFGTPDGEITVSGWSDTHYVSAKLHPRNRQLDLPAQRLNTVVIHFVDPTDRASVVPRGLSINSAADGTPLIQRKQVQDGTQTLKTPFSGAVRIVVPESSGFRRVEREVQVTGNVELTITLVRQQR